MSFLKLTANFLRHGLKWGQGNEEIPSIVTGYVGSESDLSVIMNYRLFNLHC